MGRGFIKALVVGLVLTASAGIASAQRYSEDTRTYFDYGDPFYTSMVQSADGSTLDVRLNTASSMFSFLRADNSNEKAHGKYYAIREITFEVVERGFSASLLSKTVDDTMYSQSYDETTSKNSWHAFEKSITLPSLEKSKNYALRVEIRDGVLSKLAAKPVIANLRTPDFRNATDSNGIAVSDVALFDSLNGATATTKAWGNSYMFSRDVKGAVSFQLAKALSDEQSENAIVDISVDQVTNLIDPSDTGIRAHIVVPASDLRKNETYQLAGVSNKLTYTLRPVESTNQSSPESQTWTASFTIPGKTFEQGKYEFSVRVSAGNAHRVRTEPFMLVWQNMPLSLEDPLDAIPPLAHILGQDKVDELRLGSKQEMLKKVYAYWKSQDPTPGTAFNERMSAFYQRVDYADFNFATSHALDGAMSDRGKVYVLYGAPSHIERTLLPGSAPVEVWSYANNVKREFRFEDRSAHGEYKLTEVKNLAMAAE